MKRKIEPYYVFTWNINLNSIEHYDIMPDLIECYKKDKKSRSKNAIHPKTFEEFKEFIFEYSEYHYWSRCQYEVIVSAWPPRPKRHENGDIKMMNYTNYRPVKEDIKTIDFYDYKLDVHDQIEMNLDVITKHFMEQVK